MNIEERNKAIYSAYLSDLQAHGNVSWDRIASNLPDGIDLSNRQMQRIVKSMHDDLAPLAEFYSIDEPVEEETITFNETKGGAYAYSNSTQIKTLDELIEACGADMEKWHVKHWLANAWGMGRKNEKISMSWVDGVRTGTLEDDGGWTDLQNFQVKVWFEPRIIYPIEKSVEDLMMDLASVAPVYKQKPTSLVYSKSVDPKYMFLPVLFDAHVNKLADGYSVAEARDDYIKAAKALVEQASGAMPVKEVLYIVGQDILNSDSISSQTTYGTWVESADDIRVAVDAVCKAATQATEMFAEIAPVKVVTVQSNHDRYGVYWLGKFMEARFHNHPYVTVRNGVHPRVYHKFGKVLLGIDHGDNVKPQNLGLTMAVEAAEEWSGTTYREWLRGHLHKKTDMYMPVTTEMGVTVRILPSLCPPDSWHILKGFIGNHRAAEGMFYHEDYGPAGIFPVFVDELE